MEPGEAVGYLEAVSKLTRERFMELEFSFAEEVGMLFKQYGLLHGFSTRKRDKQRLRSGEAVMHSWVCCREGHPRTVSRLRMKTSSRVGCPCQLTCRAEESGIWVITLANLEHNHDLVPGHLSSFMPASRVVTDDDMTVVKRMLSVGFRQADIMRLLVCASGGHDRVGFMLKDLNNRKLKEDRCVQQSLLDGGYAYLMALQSADEGMSLVTYRREEELVRIYWSDSKAKSDYAAFGDVVAFDSTFRTNARGLQMVVICGVNHHHHTIVFAAALMATETKDDYNWLLQTHKDVMSSKVPISVVTDSDRAMTSAIRETWPESRHRVCLWHMSRNIVRRVKDVKLCRQILTFMYSNNEVEEDEEDWEDLIEDSTGSISRGWLEQLYESRQMWWRCYCRGHFWAEFRSTQRCESMHNYMKGYLKPKHNLYDFVHHFERAIADLRHKEAYADYESIVKKVPPSTMLRGLEEDAARIYTIASFRKVQHQLQKEALYCVDDMVDGNISRMYRIISYEIGCGTYEVAECKSTKHMTCSCLHFETYGLPCAHMLHVMKVEGLRKIPETLVLKRWTKTAKAVTIATDDVPAFGINADSFRQGLLATDAREICYLGSKSPYAYDRVRRAFSKLKLDLNSHATWEEGQSSKEPGYEYGISENKVHQSSRGVRDEYLYGWYKFNAGLPNVASDPSTDSGEGDDVGRNSVDAQMIN